MNKSITVTMAAVVVTAGTAFAQEGPSGEPAAVFSSTELQAVEFTPMTRSERFRTYLTSAFGPGALAKSAVRAGYNQLMNSPKEWDGGEGYGKRFGSAYAKHIIRGTLQYGASTVLHEDDRYLASGRAGFWNRTKYALTSTLLARRDNGDRTFAVARMGSFAGAAFISNIWQPPSTSGYGHAASSFGIAVATDAGFNVFREFFPDLKRRFRRN
jgi:hypothetical protein